MRDYKKIRAHQLSDELVLEIYRITKAFPKDELYGLVSQIRRSSVSIPCNIAEGASRQHLKDYLNFLYTARGSASELEYLLSVAFKLGYLSSVQFKNVSEKYNNVAKVLFGLIQSVSTELSSR